ncbi:MAG: glycosyltransferase [Marinifilaceae bacterium]|jgi:teichuronic acid biosynthesis glycosyltransferase TuaG|nr:glycosyltransferase [Marinifilaceae bacterium]
MNNNLISIITPSYNSAQFINQTIDSVITQSYTNWEMIIVDDSSSDKSREIISLYQKKDARIKSIFLKENVGAAEARNKALEIAKGNYIAFLDSDDLWKSNKLMKQIEFMAKNQYAFTYTAYDIINEAGQFRNKIISVPKMINYNQYLKNTIIGCLTVVIDKNQVGDFRMPNIRSSHDMALWLLIMKRGFIAHGLNENLASYRIVSTSNTSNKLKAAKEVWKVYREVEQLSVLKSLYSFIFYGYNAILKRI